jgi:hypothetical protein
MARDCLLRPGFLVLALATGCGHLVYTSGPYRGQVLDAETQQALAGAVVLAIWYREVPVPPHGPAVDYHDALEVLTDAQGEFTVPAQTHLTPIGNIREPEFVIYYPGYGSYPYYKVRPRDNEVSAAYERHLFEVQLPKLKTREERMEGVHRELGVSKVPESKMPRLLNLVNKERQGLGLKPSRLGR